jgi:hypothetical protein
LDRWIDGAAVLFVNSTGIGTWVLSGRLDHLSRSSNARRGLEIELESEVGAVTNPPNPTLDEQLSQLRRSVCRSRQIAIVALLVPGLVFAAGFQHAGRQPAVEAEQFVLKDTSGKIRAKLFVDDDGCSRLRFYGEKGKTLVDVGLLEPGRAGVEASDGADDMSATFAVQQNGLAIIDLYGRDTKRLMLLSSGVDKWAEISLGPPDGEPDFQLWAAPKFTFAQFQTNSVNDPDGRTPVLSLGTDSNGGSGITLADPKQKHKVIIGGGEDGRTSIKVVDHQKKTLFQAPPP